MNYAIGNCRTLTADGAIEPGTVIVEDGRIRGLEAGRRAATEAIDGHGLLLLPGIVDIHGDAFERQVMPRPGVTFPLDVALLDTDRQMTVNGITTGFHGITYSWEPGLRGGPTAKRIVRTIRAMEPRLGCDLRVHLRFETHAVDGVEDIVALMEDGVVDALAFNDHVPMFASRLGEPARLKETAARAGLTLEAFIALVKAAQHRAAEVPAAIDRLAERALAYGIPLLSHDDETPAMRQAFHKLGCRIAEFPVDAATARAARDLGDAIVLGAPNILRGASHCGRLLAADAVADGLCTVLASDYYYPSLLQAAFRLVDAGLTDLAGAWDLISRTPARVLGLADRGEIAPGRRADLILVDDSDPELPRVVATLVAGRPVFIDDSRRGAWAARAEALCG